MTACWRHQASRDQKSCYSHLLGSSSSCSRSSLLLCKQIQCLGLQLLLLLLCLLLLLLLLLMGLCLCLCLCLLLLLLLDEVLLLRSLLPKMILPSYQSAHFCQTGMQVLEVMDCHST